MNAHPRCWACATIIFAYECQYQLSRKKGDQHYVVSLHRPSVAGSPLTTGLAPTTEDLSDIKLKIKNPSINQFADTCSNNQWP